MRIQVEGYTFNGWDQDIPLTMPASDKIFKANYSINQYSITFNTYGGDEILSITQDYATTLIAPAEPTRIGYTFLGWFSDQAFTNFYIFSTMPDKNMTLHAKWSINSYMLTFKDYDDTVLYEASYEYNTDLSDFVIEDPSREGYTFNGWDQDIPLTMPASDKIFKANYSINQYNVIFESYLKSGPTQVKTNYNEKVVYPENELSGGYIEGWYLDQSFTQLFDEMMPAKDITLYAKWTPNEDNVLIFDLEGYYLFTKTIEEFNLLNGGSVNLKEGYTFENYCFDKDCLIIYDGNPIIEPTILYEKWNINNYEISLKSIEGYYYGSVYFNYNESIVLPDTILMEGYSIVGWYMDSNLSILFTFDTMPAEDLELFAKWEINTYKLYLPFALPSGQNYLEYDYNEVVDLYDDGYIYSLFVARGYAISACSGCDKFVNFRIDGLYAGFWFRMPSKNVYLDALSDGGVGDLYDSQIVSSRTVTLIENYGTYYISANGYYNNYNGSVILTVYDSLGNALKSSSGINPSVSIWIEKNKVYKVTVRFNDPEMTQGYISISWVWDRDDPYDPYD